MSAICGLVVPPGAAMPPGGMTAMMEALAEHGPDGASVWQDGIAALGQQRNNFHGLDDPGLLPLRDAEAGVTLVLDGFLHNRREIAASLGLPSTDHVPDQALLLHSWVRWGPACAERWVGEFAVAVWEERSQQLHCITDPMGIRPLFWRELPGGGFAFASETAALLKFDPAPSLNERRLALMGLSALTGSLEPETTIFSGIYRLPAAQLLTVAQTGRRLREYWRPDPEARLRFPSDTECGDALNALLREAVEARLPKATPPAALLSGGLDSSALVALASRSLGDTGRRLLTLSAVTDKESYGQAPDERQHIEVFKSIPNLDMRFINASGCGPFDDLEALVAPGSLPSCSFQHFLYTALTREAASTGARIVLDGHGGELSASCYPAGWLAELLFRGRLVALGGELRAARRSGIGAWGVLRTQLIRPLLGPGLLRALGRQRKPDPRIAWPLRQDFVRDVLSSDAADIIEQLERKLEPGPNHRLNMITALREEQDDMRMRSHAGFVDYPKVRFSYPFLDRRVIEFALAVGGQFKQEGGIGRRLLRLAITGEPAATAMQRQDKLPFSPDYPQRFEAQRALALRQLQSFADAAPQRELVDFGRVSTALERSIRFDPGHPMRLDPEAAFLIPYALYLCYFLKQFNRIQRQSNP